MRHMIPWGLVVCTGEISRRNKRGGKRHSPAIIPSRTACEPADDKALGASTRVADSRRYEIVDDVGAAVVLRTPLLCAVALNP